MPSKTKKTTSSSTKAASSAKQAAPVKPEPVPTPVAEPTPVVVAAEEETFEDRFKNLNTILLTVVSTSKSAIQELTRLRKDVSRLQRESNKRNRRRNKNRGADGDKPKREPSGFAKPTEISEALAKFLGEKKGILLARTEVTKKITAYIKAHDLQNPVNKREIIPDAPLKKLLSLNDESEALTFFNLQRYMKPHFLKATPSA